MKQHWENIVIQVQKLIDDDAAVINGLRNGADVNKIKKNFEHNVKNLIKHIDEFAVFVPDPDREEFELPFDSLEFAEAWNDYKEFLLDVFNIVLVPVEERRRLNKIFNISKKNEQRALELLDFFICSRYKSIFQPKDFQINSDSPGDEPSNDAFTLKRKTI